MKLFWISQWLMHLTTRFPLATMIDANFLCSFFASMLLAWIIVWERWTHLHLRNFQLTCWNCTRNQILFSRLDNCGCQNSYHAMHEVLSHHKLIHYENQPSYAIYDGLGWAKAKEKEKLAQSIEEEREISPPTSFLSCMNHGSLSGAIT